MINLHMKADQHAPFAHYQLTIGPETVKVKDPRTRVITEVTREAEFTVCYFCGHWIERPLARTCRCPASCHTVSSEQE